MRLDDIKAGIVKWRGLLIISALVSLCLSDGVGPRFMPLPASEVVTALAEGYQGPEDTASRIPSHTKGANPRIEMAATAQNRAGDRYRQVQPATHAPQGMFEAPEVIISDIPGAYGPLYSLTAFASRPRGRAPPLLV